MVSAGRVGALWRYPVSSLAGEPMEVAEIGDSGVEGDRLWGVADVATGGVARPEHEKRWRIAPAAASRLAGAGAEIRVGDGPWVPAASDGAREALSAHFGFPVDVRPHPDRARDDAVAVTPRYERAAIHLLTTASLDTLRAVIPDAVVDERRFRPNVVLDTGDGATGFAETGWIGREIRLGGAVLRVEEPCVRCAFTMIAQPGLPFDKRVLGEITAKNDKGFGVLCSVVRPGAVTLADEAALLD